MIALVPMRSGSKGIPDKNIKDFLGKPLFYWNISELVKAGADVWVSTDSKRYSKMIDSFFGPEVNIFLTGIHSDTSVTWDIVKDFIDNARLSPDELLGVCQVTSPYLKEADVYRAINLTFFDDSVRTVGAVTGYYYDYTGTPLWHEFPHKRRQEEIPVFKENGCFYLSTVGWMLKNDCYHNDKTVNMMQEYSWELDTPADWVYGEAVMSE